MPEALDILQLEYEYCSISQRIEESRNALGEPVYTLSPISSTVKCSISPIHRMPSYALRVTGRIKPGISYQRLYMLIVSSCQHLEPGNIITDSNGVEYEVIYTVNWHTHKEAIISKRN
ncbi:hypothetical protein GF312_02090 [Candidatus Poribacteria bacterium]|nr:hypothetical protein [Candidatus Poribacteria bacterium]